MRTEGVGRIKPLLVWREYLPLFNGPVWWFDTSWMRVAGDLQCGQPILDWTLNTVEYGSDLRLRETLDETAVPVFEALDAIAQHTPRWAKASGKPLAWAALDGACVYEAELRHAPLLPQAGMVWKPARAALFLAAASIAEAAKRQQIQLDTKMRRDGPRSDGDLVVYAIHASYLIARHLITVDEVAAEARAVAAQGAVKRPRHRPL